MSENRKLFNVKTKEGLYVQIMCEVQIKKRGDKKNACKTLRIPHPDIVKIFLHESKTFFDKASNALKSLCINSSDKKTSKNDSVEPTTIVYDYYSNIMLCIITGVAAIESLLNRKITELGKNSTEISKKISSKYDGDISKLEKGMAIKKKIDLIPLLCNENEDAIYKKNFERCNKEEVLRLINLRHKITHAKYSTTRDPNNFKKSLWAELAPVEANKQFKPFKYCYRIFADFLEKIFPEIKTN